MHIDDSYIKQLIDTMNRYEKNVRRSKDYHLRDVISNANSLEDDEGVVDQSRSGSLSPKEKDGFSLTLKDGAIIGRGLMGEGPVRDLPGAVNARIWRLWDVRWNDDGLECLRCNHEWKPNGGRPEQCPRCCGLLTYVDDGEDRSRSDCGNHRDRNR